MIRLSKVQEAALATIRAAGEVRVGTRALAKGTADRLAFFGLVEHRIEGGEQVVRITSKGERWRAGADA